MNDKLKITKTNAGVWIVELKSNPSVWANGNSKQEAINNLIIINKGFFLSLVK